MDKERALKALASLPQHADSWSRLREKDTGSKAITNWQTQLVGNRPVCGLVAFSDGKAINLVNFQPARISGTHYGGEDNTLFIAKSASGDVLSSYAMGKVSDPVEEVYHVMAFFALSVMTGYLPTAERHSWENAGKGAILADMLRICGVTVESAQAIKGIATQSYAKGLVSASIDLCAEKMRRVESEWESVGRKSRGKVKVTI